MSQKLQPLYDNGERVKDFFFDEKTNVIYFLKSMENRKVKFSTGAKVPDIKKARRVANQEMAKRFGKHKTVISPLIKDELGSWIRVKEAEGLDPATMIKIRAASVQIEEYWGDKFPNEITIDSLAEWYSWWRVEHANIEIENAVKYFRNFAKYLAQKVVNGKALLPAVPPIKDPRAKEIKAKRKKNKERIFTHAELVKIVNSAESEVDQLIVLIMYTMATRITETLTLRFGEEVLVDKSKAIYRWTFGQNKADLSGEHDFHTAIVPRIQALKVLRDQQDSEFLFPQQHKSQPLKSQQIDWKAWRLRADLGWHWTAHTFRHTCLSNLFNDEKNPQALICKLYRVSLAVALDTYIKVTESGKARMRDAIEVNL